MEEERLEIVNVEELKKEYEKYNHGAVGNGVCAGIEILYTLRRILGLINTGNPLNILLAGLFGYWAYTFVKDMDKDQRKAMEYEEKIRHFNQEDIKNIDENVIRDDMKSERKKALLFMVLASVVLVTAETIGEKAYETSNFLLELGSAAIGGVYGYLFKKMYESLVRESSLEKDIQLIKG